MLVLLRPTTNHASQVLNGGTTNGTETSAAKVIPHNSHDAADRYNGEDEDEADAADPSTF
jgi:hypothetical protein